MSRSSRLHLNWAASRALGSVDSDNKDGAVRRYLDAVAQHTGTKWISDDPTTEQMLRDAYDDGREAFRAAMLNFTVD